MTFKPSESHHSRNGDFRICLALETVADGCATPFIVRSRPAEVKAVKGRQPPTMASRWAGVPRLAHSSVKIRDSLFKTSGGVSSKSIWSPPSRVFLSVFQLARVTLLLRLPNLSA